MADTSPRSIRLDSSLVDSLRILARAQHRSLNNLIENILRQYVEEYELLANPEFQEALNESEGDAGIPWRDAMKRV